MNPGFCLGSMERFLAAATRSVFVGLKSGTEVFLGPSEPNSVNI